MGNKSAKNNLQGSEPMVRVSDVIAVMDNTASVRVKRVVVDNPKTGAPEVLGPEDYMNILDAPKIVQYELEDDENRPDLALVKEAEPTPPKQVTAPNVKENEIDKTENAARMFSEAAASGKLSGTPGAAPSDVDTPYSVRSEEASAASGSTLLSDPVMMAQTRLPSITAVTARWVGMGEEDHASVWIMYEGSRKGKLLNENDVVDINGTKARILAFVGDALKSRPMYALVTSDDQQVYYAKFIEIMRGFGENPDTQDHDLFVPDTA